MLKLNIKNQLGFSLIELLVAATIIALLSAVGLVSYVNANKSARDARRKSDLEQVRAGIELYRSSEGTYPSSSSYSGMMTEIEDYISNDDALTDPRPSPHPQYEYDNTPAGTDCSAYQLCATLESDGSEYCICNP